MEWLHPHPETEEPQRWWTIKLRTGQPDHNVVASPADYACLGESVLESIGEAADMLATTFATRDFGNVALRRLLWNREVPATFRGGREDAFELVELANAMWIEAESYYRDALDRPPSEVERRWLMEQAVLVIRLLDSDG